MGVLRVTNTCIRIDSAFGCNFRFLLNSTCSPFPELSVKVYNVKCSAFKETHVFVCYNSFEDVYFMLQLSVDLRHS